MVEECIRLKPYREETLTSRSKLSLTNLVKTIQQSFSKLMKEMQIPTLFMDHIEFSREDCLFREPLEILKQKERSFKVIQMLSLLYQR
jgi:hypothetical protein